MDGAQHPWVGGNLTIPRAVVARLEAEAKAAYGRDEEACGYLTGPAADPLLADDAVLMPNLANKYHALDPEAYPRKGNMYFLLDARKFQRAIDEGPTAGRPVKVLWHSHLDVGAYFSETDAAAANMGGDAPANDLAYLVTSVRRGEVDDHKLFVWNASAKAYVETTLTLTLTGEGDDRLRGPPPSRSARSARSPPPSRSARPALARRRRPALARLARLPAGRGRWRLRCPGRDCLPA